jgi:hypothetical protein
MTRFLFRIARLSAWSRAIGRAATGRPGALARRVRNRPLYKIVGRIARK